MKDYVSSIALKHAGKPVGVLCGGPSLPSQLDQIAHCAALISANDHGCILQKCDYIVACDLVHTVTREDMERRLRRQRVPIVSPLFYADYRIPDWTAEWNSGMHGIYLAWLLGAHPIIVAGLDCYTGDTYFHTAGVGASSGHTKGLALFQAHARQLQAAMPGACVRLAGGPLVGLWPAHDPVEVLPPWQASPALQAQAVPPALARVRMLQSASLWKNPLRMAFHYQLTQGEAAGLVGAGLAAYL